MFSFEGTLITGLSERVKFLQTQLSNAPLNSTQRYALYSYRSFDKHFMNVLLSPKSLPCIEDAWNFPISQEMASRQNAFQRQNQGPTPTDESFSNVKRQKSEGPSRMAAQAESGVSPPSQVYLNPQQMQLMNYLHQNQV